MCKQQVYEKTMNELRGLLERAKATPGSTVAFEVDSDGHVIWAAFNKTGSPVLRDMIEGKNAVL